MNPNTIVNAQGRTMYAYYVNGIFAGYQTSKARRQAASA